MFASFSFKSKDRPARGACSDQRISLALAAVLRVSIHACSVYGRSDNFIQVSRRARACPRPHAQQVRFACDVSIGADFYLAETRALDTFNFLLVRLCTHRVIVWRSLAPCAFVTPSAVSRAADSAARFCRGAAARARERLPALLRLEQRRACCRAGPWRCPFTQRCCWCACAAAGPAPGRHVERIRGNLLVQKQWL